MSSLERTESDQTRREAAPCQARAPRTSTSIFTLALVLAAHATFSAFVLRADRTPLTPDAFEYYRKGLVVRGAVTESAQPVRDALKLLRDCCHIRPPLPLLFQLPAHLSGSSHPDRISLLGNLPVLALLMLFTFLLGRQLFGNSGGVLAAVVVSLFPIVVGHTRTLLADLHLAAFVTGTAWALVRLRQSGRLAWAAVAGAMAGAGLLSKLSYPLLAVGPWIWFVATAIRGGWWARRVLAALALAAAVVLLLFGPWLVEHWQVVAWYQRQGQLLGSVHDGVATWSVAGIFYNIRHVWRSQLFPFWTRVTAVCAAVALSSRWRRKGRAPGSWWLLTSWWLLGHFALAMITLKHVRNGIPLLPVCALVCVGVLSRLGKPWRSLASAGIVGVGSALVIWFGVGTTPWKTHPMLPDLGSINGVGLRMGEKGVLQPMVQDWKQMALLEQLLSYGQRIGRPPRALVAGYLNLAFLPLQYHAARLRAEIRLRFVDNFSSIPRWEKRLRRTLKESDVLLVRRSGSPGSVAGAEWVLARVRAAGYRPRRLFVVRYPFDNLVEGWSVVPVTKRTR